MTSGAYDELRARVTSQSAPLRAPLRLLQFRSPGSMRLTRFCARGGFPAELRSIPRLRADPAVLACGYQFAVFLPEG